MRTPGASARAPRGFRRGLCLLGLIAGGGGLTGTAATTAAATPKEFAASLCVALDSAYGVVSGGYRYDHWVCRPGGMTANGTREYRVWVRERHWGRTRHWYLVILPDATVLDYVEVAYPGDTGSLLSS